MGLALPARVDDAGRNWHCFTSGSSLLFGGDASTSSRAIPRLHSLVAAKALSPLGDGGLTGAIVLMWALGPVSSPVPAKERAAVTMQDPLVSLTT